MSGPYSCWEGTSLDIVPSRARFRSWNRPSGFLEAGSTVFILGLLHQRTTMKERKLYFNPREESGLGRYARYQDHQEALKDLCGYCGQRVNHDFITRVLFPHNTVDGKQCPGGHPVPQFKCYSCHTMVPTWKCGAAGLQYKAHMNPSTGVKCPASNEGLAAECPDCGHVVPCAWRAFLPHGVDGTTSMLKRLFSSFKECSSGNRPWTPK